SRARSGWTMRPSCVPSLLSPLLLRGRGGDVSDLQRGVQLTVTDPLLVTGLVLVLLDPDLVALVVVHHFGLRLDTGQHPGVAGHRVAVDHEQGRELYGVANLAVRNTVNLDDVANRDLLLTPAGAHDRVHAELSLCSIRNP